ncbi:hypothetical protein GF367_02130 [Candidatus Woesearchaeota archaeon]|nr:hypothetical protein [Candidatus Woesearchaeota archaeon]
MPCRRAQSSIEYLFIVVLALTLILPASFLFFDFSRTSEDSVIGSQINRVGNEILDAAEQVYVIGNNSRVTLDLVFPESLVSSVIYDEVELVISYYTQGGLTQAVFFSDVPLMNGSSICVPNCTLRFGPGVNSVMMTSRGDGVSVVRS